MEAIAPTEVSAGLYLAGECFGERALTRVEPRPVTVTCRTDVTVLRLTAATFAKLKEQAERKAAEAAVPAPSRVPRWLPLALVVAAATTMLVLSARRSYK